MSKGTQENLQSTDSESIQKAAGPKAIKTSDFSFLDLRAQFLTIRSEILSAVERVLEAQRFILGQEVQRFEQEVADKLGSRFAVGCASGTDALLLSLMALGVAPGDEVVTTPFTFGATVGPIVRLHSRPVFVDIDSDTFNMDPGAIEAVLTPRTRALLPVHLFGLQADMNSIMRIANDRRLAVIEDAAQAIGARNSNGFAGSLGTFGCFSFFPSKNLGGAGDGGLVTTNDEVLADRLRMLRVHGCRQKYHYEILGINSRLDALQAAILSVKLKYLDGWTAARLEKAERYRLLFAAYGLKEYVKLPLVPQGRVHVYNQFVVRCSEREKLREFMRDRGVPTEIYYPLPLHLQPAFATLGYQSGQFPRAEAASREVLALPIYPELTEGRQEFVVHTIAEFYGLGG